VNYKPKELHLKCES